MSDDETAGPIEVTFNGRRAVMYPAAGYTRDELLAAAPEAYAAMMKAVEEVHAGTREAVVASAEQAENLNGLFHPSGHPVVDWDADLLRLADGT